MPTIPGREDERRGLGPHLYAGITGMSDEINDPGGKKEEKECPQSELEEYQEAQDLFLGP